MDKATAKSLAQIVDLLETKSAQSTEIYLGVSASGSQVYNLNLTLLIICFASLTQKTIFLLNNDKVSSTSFSSTLGVQALLPESWYRCVHTLSTRYVTVYTLHRFRLVGSVAGSAPVLTTKQKTCAHTGTVPEFWGGCLNGCVHINTQAIP